MPTAGLPGFQGSVKIYNTNTTEWITFGEVMDSTWTFTADDLDATSYNSAGWREYIYGLQGWELNVETLYLNSDTSQDIAWNMVFGRAKQSFAFTPNNVGTGQGYQGPAIIPSFEVGTPVDDKIVLSLVIRGTGEMTEFTPPTPTAP